MTNERLRDALLRERVTPGALARELGVNPKTVERWIREDRTPYRRHRHTISARLGEAETWLWPAAIDQARVDLASASELVHLFPRRASIPSDFWPDLFGSGTAFMDVLVYAGLFLPEQTPAVVQLLAAKANQGARVRVLLGDPESPAVALRGHEEQIGDAVAVKVRNALGLLSPFQPRESLASRGGVAVPGTWRSSW